MWCHVLLFGFPAVGLVLFWVLPLPAAVALYAPLSALSLWVGVVTLRALRQPVSTGAAALRDRVGRVEAVAGQRLTVRVDTELWTAVSREPLPVGEAAVVEGVDGLTLKVRARSGSAANEVRT